MEQYIDPKIEENVHSWEHLTQQCYLPPMNVWIAHVVDDFAQPRTQILTLWESHSETLMCTKPVKWNADNACWSWKIGHAWLSNPHHYDRAVPSKGVDRLFISPSFEEFLQCYFGRKPVIVKMALGHSADEERQRVLHTNRAYFTYQRSPCYACCGRMGKHALFMLCCAWGSSRIPGTIHSCSV